MSLTLPDFNDRKCLELACCGFIPAEKGGKPREDIKDQTQSMTARYTKSGREVYMRLYLPFPWESPGGRVHVHVVLAPKERFAKEPPKVSHKPEDIIALISKLMSEKIDLHITGMFRVPTTELPAFIRSTSVETVVNDIQLRLTGGTVSVRGAPIQSMTWELPHRSAVATITLDARTRLDLDESYLVKSLDLVESTFKAIIVGDKSDAEKP